MSTATPARMIQRPQLGTLHPGSHADIAVLRLDKGNFGLLDSAGAKYPGDLLLNCEMTIRAGKAVWDLNGRAALNWKSFPYKRRPSSR